MSKSCCFAVMLAVICLSVILFSVEAVAQPTVDETMTCGSSTSDDVLNVVKLVASNQQGIKDEIREQIGDVKKLLRSNPNQGANQGPNQGPNQCPNQCVAVEPSKQALISALECKYIACFYFYDYRYIQ